MKTPLIDKRNYDDIIEEIRSLVPNYTPEWKFDINNPDVGTSLLMVFAMQVKETIDLLNRSLNKNFISYLNMSDLELRPTKSAQVPVVFSLTSDEVSVFVEKGTKLTTNAGENVNFETQEDLEVVPVKINSCFYANDNIDKIIKADIENISLFDYENENNIQSHYLYIIDDFLFNIEGSCDIVIRLNYEKKGAKPLKILSLLCKSKSVTWEFYAGKLGWIKFDEITKKDNQIILSKRNNIQLESYEEVDSRAIRLTLRQGNLLEYQNIYFDVMDIQISKKAQFLNEINLKTDKLFNNDRKINNDLIMPFDMEYNISDLFYICCDEALTKQKSIISVDMDIAFIDNYNKKPNVENVKWKLVMKQSAFDKEAPIISSIKEVDWYYYNGVRWEPLRVEQKSKQAFYCELEKEELDSLIKDIRSKEENNTENKAEKNVNEAAEAEKINDRAIRKKIHSKLAFICPDDLMATEVCGQAGYFIRGEIKNIENNYEYNSIAMIPVISDLYLNYNYADKYIYPNALLTINNNEKKYFSYELGEYSNYIVPFYGVKSSENTLYICLNKPVGSGSVNILFIINKVNDIADIPNIRVEYLTRKNNEEFWKDINIKDETFGLTKTGIITLLGLDNFIAKDLFGENGYWLKLILPDEVNDKRLISSIYFNGVWAVQQTSVFDEYIDKDIESSNYSLFFTPALEAEIWVNEINSLNKAEISEIIKNNSLPYQEVYDDMGILEEFWIKWTEASTFVNKSFNDRVYIINRQSGLITFGDNINGKTPPNSNKAIKCNYRYGGGQAGNILANSINGLYESKAFIDKVFNPIHAVGGIDFEAVDEAIQRQTNIIRHQNKAISITDIENLILDNFKDIQDVKCLSNKNRELNNKNGDVSIIILPKLDIGDGISNVIRDRIYDFLSDKVPVALSSNKLHILSAKPIIINVKVTIYCSSKDNPYYIKRFIEQRLDEFLNYKSGSFDGKGWRIGEIPNKTAIYAAISKIDGVASTQIKNITISYIDEAKTDAIEMNVETADKVLDGIIVNGKHEINIIVGNN